MNLRQEIILRINRNIKTLNKNNAHKRRHFPLKGKEYQCTHRWTGTARESRGIEGHQVGRYCMHLGRCHKGQHLWVDRSNYRRSGTLGSCQVSGRKADPKWVTLPPMSSDRNAVHVTFTGEWGGSANESVEQRINRTGIVNEARKQHPYPIIRWDQPKAKALKLISSYDQ